MLCWSGVFFSLLPGIGQVLALPVRMLGHRVSRVPAAVYGLDLVSSGVKSMSSRDPECLKHEVVLGGLGGLRW